MLKVDTVVTMDRHLVWTGFFGLTLAACQPLPATTAGDGQADAARLAAIEAQLATITTRLDTITAKLDETNKSLEVFAEESAARKSRSDMISDMLADFDMPKGFLPGSARDPSDPSDVTEDDPPIRHNFIEGIECEDRGTDARECKIPKAPFVAALDNPSTLIRQARIVPATKDGESAGFKFYGIRPDSLPKQLGIKNGDLLRKIDDTPLTSIDSVMTTMSGVANRNKIVLHFLRKDQPFTLTLKISPA